ncbi:MAG TPA: hypothetical protein VM264_02130 [Acidimicrobiales bacterium]|nr:hypothetical protein [Acidimicrobiales bacterium]
MRELNAAWAAVSSATLPVEYRSRYQVLEGDPTQASLLVFILDEIVGGNSA